MVLFKKADDLRHYLEQKKKQGLNVGFVPTMGALHAGHISLITTAKSISDITVCSIFVNPTQFNDPKDFEKYPSTIEQDILFLEKNKTDVLFLPSVQEIYPDGSANLEHYDLGYLETILEGKYRPGHFQGVCQVMSRLLKLVMPQHLFMGQKDYQQCMVVKKLIELINLKTIFHTCPTMREIDGLAMSSRNMRLNEEERKNAVAIYEALIYIKKNISSITIDKLIEHAKSILEKNNFRIDYVEIADAGTLQLKDAYSGKEKLVALVAAFQNQVRLIDNMIIS
ncbi:MAG TPA: pantoate--beta-alanine ligase [Puia sp.]|nr:pantoate--beta-alanine ligase [Puia sp.]